MINLIRLSQRLAGSALSSQAASALLHGVIAVSIAAMGVLGVLQQPGKLPSARGWSDIRGLFGAALLLGVIVLFAWHASHPAFACAKSITDFARRVSRQIYLLLYALAGIKMIAFLMAKPQLSLADAMKAMQSYAIYAVLALLTIRVLTALCHFYLIPRNLRAFHRR
jgi:hypothetical protein